MLNPVKYLKTIIFLGLAFLIWSAWTGKGWLHDVPLMQKMELSLGRQTVRWMIFGVGVLGIYLFFRVVV